MQNTADRITLSGGLNISRLVCGLWQVADLEKGGAANGEDAKLAEQMHAAHTASKAAANSNVA